MKIIKKIICVFTSGIILFTSNFNTINASSKVIEPEIVKTESWTTSYYIDDDTETLYPYIQCEANIYNDGTIKLYMWNTHEWDGFATISHDLTIVQTIPMSQESRSYLVAYSIQSGNTVDYEYKVYNQNGYYETRHSAIFISNDTIDYDLSYYRGSYNCLSSHGLKDTYYVTYTYAIYDEFFDGSFRNCEMFGYNRKSCALPKISPNEKTLWYTFTPKVDPTGTYKFRLYGHDITITPELLSGNIVSEPELTEQEKYIKQLEEENKSMKQELEVYKNYDSDNDGMFTANDAQMILNYYGEYLSGNVSGEVTDYGDFVSSYVNTDNKSQCLLD